MLDFLSPLSNWAVTLRESDLPPSLLEDVHLQHALLFSKIDPSSPYSISTQMNWMGAPVEHVWGAVGACLHAYAWTVPKLKWDKYLMSIAIGEECAVRLGAYMWLMPSEKRAIWMRMMGLVAVHSVVHSYSANEMKNLFLLCVDTLPQFSREGIEQSPYAIDELLTAQLKIAVRRLENNELAHPKVRASASPLHHAFLGLGELYFSSVRVFNTSAGSLTNRSAYEAMDRILVRHVKAADRPIRPDQVSSIEIHLSGPLPKEDTPLTPGSLRSHLPYLIAARIIARELSPTVFTSEWVTDNANAIRELANRVNCHVLPLAFEQDWCENITAMGPLFSGVPLKNLLNSLGVTGLRGSRSIKRSLNAIGNQPFKANYFHIDEWVPSQRTEVYLYTTRGGKWPERSEAISGGAGQWGDVVQALKEQLPKVKGSTLLKSRLKRS